MDLLKQKVLIEKPLQGQVLELEPELFLGKNGRTVYLRSIGTDKIYRGVGRVENLNIIFIYSQNPSIYPFFNGKALIEASLPVEEDSKDGPICVRMLAKIDNSPISQLPIPGAITPRAQGFFLHIVQIDDVNKLILEKMLDNQTQVVLMGASVR